MVKIRLARHGRKKRPFYYIVIADSKSPRDGRYIERIGSFNPNTNPATIDLDFDKALDWYQKGAQPSDTCRTILSYEGVLMKSHLLKGVTKGALTEEQAEEKYQNWKEEKTAKIQEKVDGLKEKADQKASKRLAAESKIREAKAQELAKRNSALAKELGLLEEETEVKEEPKKEEAATKEKTAEVTKKVTAKETTTAPEEKPEAEKKPE